MAAATPASHQSYQLKFQGNAKPKIKELLSVRKFGKGILITEWKHIGHYLLDEKEEYYINIINKNNLHDCESAAFDFYSKWLQIETHATWNQLVEALFCLGLEFEDAANELLECLIEEDSGKTFYELKRARLIREYLTKFKDKYSDLKDVKFCLLHSKQVVSFLDVNQKKEITQLNNDDFEGLLKCLDGIFKSLGSLKVALNSLLNEQNVNQQRNDIGEQTTVRKRRKDCSTYNDNPGTQDGSPKSSPKSDEDCGWINWFWGKISWLFHGLLASMGIMKAVDYKP